MTGRTSRAVPQLLPEEQSVEGSADPSVAEAQAEAILAESEERTVHADPDDAQGGHRAVRGDRGPALTHRAAVSPRATSSSQRGRGSG